MAVVTGPTGRAISTAVFMDTTVTVEIDPARPDGGSASIERAFEWFREVEARCSRFDRESELSRLLARPGTPVPVGNLLFRAVEFAVAVAEATGGAFDPAVGGVMQRNGFSRNYRTGERVAHDPGNGSAATYRDVVLDPLRQTITLQRPLVLDLGAVAKGMAIDLAAESLAGVENFAINAGGDVYARGLNSDGQTWGIGIRHPREPGALIESIRISGEAVCTSGDYERHRPGNETKHHIVEPGSGRSATKAISATVIAPTAMLADALATAAFVLGPTEGVALLERHGVEGFLVAPSLERFETGGWGRYRG